MMPRNKPMLFRSPVRPGESWRFKKKRNHRGHILVNAGSMRFLPASLRCGLGGSRCPHRSDARTDIRDSVNEAVW